MGTEAQKKAFAVDYYQRPQDAVVIAARVLGDAAKENPMLAINAAADWPLDDLIKAELEILRNKPTPKRDYVQIAMRSYQDCMNRGEEKSAVEFLKIAVQLDGHINGKGNEPKNGKSHLLDLAGKIVDLTDTGEPYVEETEADNG